MDTRAVPDAEVQSEAVASPPSARATPVEVAQVDVAPAQLARPILQPVANRANLVAEPLPAPGEPLAAAGPTSPVAGGRTAAQPAELLPAPLDTAAQLVSRPAVTARAAATRVAAPTELQAPTLTTAAALAATAAAAMPTQPPPLDMARHTWPAAMIARIERLRDAADAVATTIRLIPDALGAIDVSLRREGEVTHVHLAADQPQTRALLADAAPKLAELAEQRGLRLSDAQVQTGPGSGSGQQSAPRQTPPRATAPQPAAPAHPESSTPDDRIA